MIIYFENLSNHRWIRMKPCQQLFITAHTFSLLWIVIERDSAKLVVDFEGGDETYKVKGWMPIFLTN